MATETMCVECEDTAAAVRCETCQDVYCELCFEDQHRAGTRRTHKTTSLGTPEIESKDASHDATSQPLPSQLPPAPATKVQDTGAKAQSTKPKERQVNRTDVQDDSDDESDGLDEVSVLLRSAKYIPLRLSEEERALYTLLDASLNVSEYTDNVDVLSYRSPVKRILQELAEAFSTVSGMMIANDFRNGRRLVQDKKLEDNGDFFRTLFEIGRRYKIMNPERMRNNYGKMIYLLQDANLKEIRKQLGFSSVGDIRTVGQLLKEKDGSDLLQDARCDIATAVITGDPSTAKVHAEEKKHAMEDLIADYTSHTLSEADIRLCLESIGDSKSYIASNRTPITRMIEYLQTYFSPDKIEQPFSLEVRAGKRGARLSHSHSTQYEYVLQSLLLWRNITASMLRLWWAVESDLLGGSMYRLKDTGQGLNRVQHAPTTSRLVHDILHETQRAHSRWIGSSVVHLGDRDVPNALMFIDKYTQISRILSPIVNTLDELEELSHKPETQTYIIDGFGGVETLRKTILCDFFQHGFDGSGADNFFDAGSCIDGRLTSAWNWCSQIEKKSFFHVFLMAGFVGFDGQFEK